MKVPEVFDLPGATFCFMANGSKYPPIIPVEGWQLPGNGHSYTAACNHYGNVGFIAGNGYIGFDQDNLSAFTGLSLPDTTTWETRPGRLGKLFTGTVDPELMKHYGKAANHSQFKLFKDQKVIGEIKLQRCYQVIPNSWKITDEGKKVYYKMVDSQPPAHIDLATLMSDVLSLPGVSLYKNPKSDTATCPNTRMPHKAPNRPVAPAPANASSYALAALLCELQKTETAPVSTRYDQVYRSACNLGELCAAHLLPYDATEKALIDAGVKAGLPRHKAAESAINGLNRTINKPRWG